MIYIFYYSRGKGKLSTQTSPAGVPHFIQLPWG